jgi:hypothetical protein
MKPLAFFTFFSFDEVLQGGHIQVLEEKNTIFENNNLEEI